MKRLALTVAVGLALTACGGGDSNNGTSTPTTPSAPTIAQVGGVWTGSVVQTSASGGDCVGPFFQQSNGASDRYTVTISQSGTFLTATASSQTSGSSCTYSGTAGSNTLALNFLDCQSGAAYRVTCAGGFQRDIYLRARSITGTVSGNVINGTTGETWNVYPVGTMSNPFGNLIVNDGFTFSR